MKPTSIQSLEDGAPNLLLMWMVVQGAVHISEFFGGGMTQLLRSQGDPKLIAGFEALTEALYWLDEELERGVTAIWGEAGRGDA